MKYLAILTLTLSSLVSFGQDLKGRFILSRINTLADTLLDPPPGYGGLRFNRFKVVPAWQFSNGTSWFNLGAGGVSSCRPAGHQFTSAHTLALTDINTCNNMGVIRMIPSAAVNLTIPLHASVAFGQWAQIGVTNEGTDTVTVVCTGGVTGNPTTIEIPPQGAALLINADGANTWDLVGGGSGGSFTLTDGNGTTANGSAVDLGGTLNQDAILETGSYAFIMNKSAALNFQIDADGSLLHHYTDGSVNSYIASNGNTSSIEHDATGFDEATAYINAASTLNTSGSTSMSATYQTADGKGYFIDITGITQNPSPGSANNAQIQMSSRKQLSGGGSPSWETTFFLDSAGYKVGTNGSGGAVDRFTIEPDGSWNIGGSNGTSGQYFQSTGSTTAPTWVTPNRLYSNNFSQTGTATTVFTVTIGTTQANNTYEVVVTPTSVLAAALFYVTNKTTTTFDVTYLAGLTGAVSFDWILRP